MAVLGAALAVAWACAHPHPHPIGTPEPKGSATPVEPPPDAAIEPAVPDQPTGPQAVPVPVPVAPGRSA